VLNRGPAVLRDVAMATNYGMQFAITCFVGYNFGCMIASNTQFDSGGGFSGSIYPEIECQRVIAMATDFGPKVVINWLCVDNSD